MTMLLLLLLMMMMMMMMMAVWRGAECVLTPPPSSSPPPCTACGPCLCCDSGQTVNCSSRSLTAVPHMALLPSTATTLLLHNNSIPLLQPSGFKGLPSLHNLDLSHNLLTNITAEVFEGLGQLLSLNLSDNQITFESLSPLEKPFLFLESLTHLDLKSNLLSDVSRRRGLSSHSLQWLDLSHNRIITNCSREEAYMLNDLFNLTFLNVSHNRLQSPKGLFHGMRRLQTLDLSHNQIPLNDSAYPSHVFEPLRLTLAGLALEGNCEVTSANHSLGYPDQAMSILTALKSLRIDGLPHVGFGPGFHSMTSLAKLSLSGLSGGYCYVSELTNTTFQSMPTSLRQLNLSNCTIVHIEKNAFRHVRGVKVLDLSFNMDLGFDRLGEAVYSLQGSALRVLHINAVLRPYTRFVMVTPHNTRYFKNTTLTVIHARDNHLETFCEGALNNMPDTLQFVNVNENSLGFDNYFKDLRSLKSLTKIFNDGYRHSHVPPTEYPRHHFPQCQARLSRAVDGPSQCQRSCCADDSAEVMVSQPPKGGMDQGVSLNNGKLIFTLPPALETYVSRWNKLYYQLLDIDFNPNNSLRNLDLSNNLLVAWVGPVKGLNNLVTLNIANNLAYRMSETFFDTLTSLKSLNMSRNNLLQFVQDQGDGRWLQPLDQLEKLDMSKSRLHRIPKEFFNGLIKLQSLYLSGNELQMFDVNITVMHNLSVLDLSYNQLNFLPQFVMDHLDQMAVNSQQNVTVKLTFNPLACTCENIGFLNWIKNSPVHFPRVNGYNCRMPDGTVRYKVDIFEIIMYLQSICTDHLGVFVGAASCFICLMIVLVAAVAYRYRWKLRYLYYASRLFYSHVDSQEGDDFIYDAFVSYSSENNDFVHGQLREELETRAHLRLNIHNRDFTPGRPIPSNIVDAVQKSRHTLVVLTRDLLESDWCHYEMQMATMEASYSGRDVLIFLLYEEVPSHELPRDVFYNLQASTYIAYPRHADPPIVRDFWARLVQALQH